MALILKGDSSLRRERDGGLSIRAAAFKYGGGHGWGQGNLKYRYVLQTYYIYNKSNNFPIVCMLVCMQFNTYNYVFI